MSASKRFNSSPDGSFESSSTGAAQSNSVRFPVLAGLLMLVSILSIGTLAVAQPADSSDFSICLKPVPSADLRHCDFAYRSLRGADLSGVDLRGVSLAFADLTGATLRGARLENARLTWAILRDADLSFATVTDADMRLSDLRGANLQGLDASRAELSNAALDPQQLGGARLDGAVLPEGTLCEDLSCPIHGGIGAEPKYSVALFAP